jgi:hypothetical protein
LVGVDALDEASAFFLPLPLAGFPAASFSWKVSSHSCGVAAPFGHFVRPWYHDDAGPLAPQLQWHDTARGTQSGTVSARARPASGQGRQQRHTERGPVGRIDLLNRRHRVRGMCFPGEYDGRRAETREIKRKISEHELA